MSNLSWKGQPTLPSRIGRARLYETVAERLATHISETQLAPGTRIPSERTLTEQFGVSRATLKQALISLEVRGILVIKHGDGVYVASPDASPVGSTLTARRRKLADIIQARQILECEVVALAAINCTHDDLIEISDCLDAAIAAESVRGSVDTTVDHSMKFHNAIAAATHNDVLRDLVEHLVAPTHQAINAAITDPVRSNSDHRLILDALRRHDPAAARDVMASHVSHFGEVQMPRL